MGTGTRWGVGGWGASPAAVAAAYDEHTSYTSYTQVVAPTPDFVRKCRGEVTIVGELCEAWRLADASSVMSMGWDESTKFQTGLMSTNLQVRAGSKSGVTPGSILDVVGRGCFVIPGGTANQVATVSGSYHQVSCVCGREPCVSIKYTHR